MSKKNILKPHVFTNCYPNETYSSKLFDRYNSPEVATKSRKAKAACLGMGTFRMAEYWR